MATYGGEVRLDAICVTPASLPPLCSNNYSKLLHEYNCRADEALRPKANVI